MATCWTASRPEQAQRSSGKCRHFRQFLAGTALRLFRPTNFPELYHYHTTATIDKVRANFYVYWLSHQLWTFPHVCEGNYSEDYWCIILAE